MLSDQNERNGDGRPAIPLHDFLDAFQAEGAAAASHARLAGADLRSAGDWGPAHSGPTARSAREWREEWQVQHRPALKEPRNWKPLWLALALAITVGLSIYGVCQIDQAVHEGVVPPALKAGHTAPAIHWGGQ
jgi:hypothetical protein